MKTLYHECFFGLGDNIYERPFVLGMAKDYDRVYIQTPFPQLYWDQDPEKFFFIPRHSRLHLQEASIHEFTGWAVAPDPDLITRRTCFWMASVGDRVSSYYERFLQASGLSEVVFDLPLHAQWEKKAIKLIEDLGVEPQNLCLIKRPTVRREWNCPARNPKIEYFQKAVDSLKHEHFMVSLAHVREGEEWLDGDLTGVDLELHNGEVDVWTLFALAGLANLSLACPSFMVPLSLATGCDCFCIFGGFMSPEKYTHGLAPHQGYAFAAPEPFCDCGGMAHTCSKEIPDFEKRFSEFSSWHLISC